jgi:ubiquinone/menaquinone biosynthesis C-methylase UbiE
MTDAKRAEKEYLRRTAGGDWERFKPFAAPSNQPSAEEAGGLIHDFAVMLRLLAPGPNDLILDVGAGACWVTDWLLRLNLRVVSVDLAFDMLRLGRDRLPSPERGRLVVGDLEQLPFASGAFDRLCCMSAIHHVPSIPGALREVSRVLGPRGRAVFVEPGAGHASKAHSRTAMRDFGVLEQDIVVADFMRQCSDAGFEHVSVASLAYVLPEAGFTRDEWIKWRRHGKTKRPVRAAGKMWRAALEFFGLGKGDVLFEESWRFQLSRILGELMEDHPIIVASKTAPDRRQWPVEYGSVVDVREATRQVAVGETVRVRVSVRNTGSLTWRASMEGPRPTRVGLQLLAEDGRVLDREYGRGNLPHDVRPEENCEVTIEHPAPPPGSYRVKIDVVMENVTWFEPNGSPTVTFPLEVTP